LLQDASAVAEAMADKRCWMLDSSAVAEAMADKRCWMLDSRCLILDTWCSILDAGCWVLDAGFLSGLEISVLRIAYWVSRFSLLTSAPQGLFCSLHFFFVFLLTSLTKRSIIILLIERRPCFHPPRMQQGHFFMIFTDFFSHRSILRDRIATKDELHRFTKWDDGCSLVRSELKWTKVPKVS